MGSLGRVLILVEEGFEDMEYFVPYYRLIEEGFTVDTASTRIRVIFGKHGYTAKPQILTKDVEPGEYNGLIIPGGKSPGKLRLDMHTLRVTRDIMVSGRIVATVCHGPQVLISAGVLKGRRITCHPSIKDDVMLAGASYIDQPVVVDKNLISSRKSEDLPYFCRELVRALKGLNSK